MKNLLDEIKRTGGIDSLILLKEGIREQSYFSHSEKPVPVNSITKSVVSLLVGIALEKGLMSNLDDKVSKYIKGYELDDRLTIRNLLTMSSGMDWGAPVLDEPYTAELLKSGDWLEYISRKSIVQDRVGKFKYNGASSHILGKAVAEASGMTLEDFAVENLFGPLGIDYQKESETIEYEVSGCSWTSKRTWDVDPQGNNIGAFSLRLKAGDLIRLGQLILDGGMFNGKRLLSQSYLEQATTEQTKAQGIGGYGYQFWIKKIKGVKLISALGTNNKYLTVIPERKAILALLSDVDNQSNMEIEKLYVKILLGLI